jgi:hypothetical protein
VRDRAALVGDVARVNPVCKFRANECAPPESGHARLLGLFFALYEMLSTNIQPKDFAPGLSPLLPRSRSIMRRSATDQDRGGGPRWHGGGARPATQPAASIFRTIVAGKGADGLKPNATKMHQYRDRRGSAKGIGERETGPVARNRRRYTMAVIYTNDLSLMSVVAALVENLVQNVVQPMPIMMELDGLVPAATAAAYIVALGRPFSMCSRARGTS